MIQVRTASTDLQRGKLPLDALADEQKLIEELKAALHQPFAEVAGQWKAGQAANATGQMLQVNLRAACAARLEKRGWAFGRGDGSNSSYVWWDSPADDYWPGYRLQLRMGQGLGRVRGSTTFKTNRIGPRGEEAIQRNALAYDLQTPLYALSDTDEGAFSDCPTRREVWLICREFPRARRSAPSSLSVWLIYPVSLGPAKKTLKVWDQRPLFTIVLDGSEDLAIGPVAVPVIPELRENGNEDQGESKSRIEFEMSLQDG